MRARWVDWMEHLPVVLEETEQIEIEGEYPIWVYQKNFQSELNLNMKLLVFSEGKQLEPMLWKQAVEGIRLAMNLWGRDHDKIGLLELVRSIIQDEPIKMRRLAGIYKIDVESISDIWILQCKNKGRLSSLLENVRELSGRYANVSICELYEEDILIFPVGQVPLHQSDDWGNALLQLCENKGLSAMLTRCAGLSNTEEVKNAYLTVRAFMEDAQVIFPFRQFFTFQEMLFAKQCRDITEGGEESIRHYMALLDAVSVGRDGDDVLKSLAVYLLDEHCNVTNTAARMFVHKNTIKYRLQKTGDILGFRIGDMPSSQNLIFALAISRLLVGMD